jgi:hypothetical protein
VSEEPAGGAEDPAQQFADWSYTIVEAIQALRGEIPPDVITGAEAIEHVIRSARSVVVACGAVMDAMIRTARAGAEDNAAAMSWQQLGDAFGHTRASVRERHQKITAPGYEPREEDRWLSARHDEEAPQ